jgi:hypothetical protein
MYWITGMSRTIRDVTDVACSLAALALMYVIMGHYYAHE